MNMFPKNVIDKIKILMVYIFTHVPKKYITLAREKTTEHMII